MQKLWMRVAIVALFVLAGAPTAWADEPEGHAAPSEDAHGEAAAHADAAAHGGHHAPSLDDVNWYYGILLEREGVEPSLLFRPKGMPVPFLGFVLNALVLYAILYRFAKTPVREGLARRKANIERGMKDAAEHKANAQARLDEYEEKLATIEREVERVRNDMREGGELERTRVLADARARRERLERDAKLLVEQEFAAARENLTRELVEAALRSATNTLKTRVTPADHARFADEYLARLSSVKGVSRAARSDG
ncbi:MAG TPA: ATP synthase F0 subunit B [Polyangiaceae bacterium]|nr:ATP synthase F0 subunit B [Polyangiaceae bacterium]